MYYTFIAVCLLILSATTHAASCNYATFSVKTLYPTLNIGIFSLSTNRCQALKATLKLHESFLGFKFELPFDGSLKLKCEAQPNEEYRVGVALFSDPLCNEPVSMNGDDDEEDDAGDRSIYVDMTKNNKFTIYEDIQFSLDEMSCDAGQTSCGISMEMAKNCSWSDSERYINISVPDAHCVSLAPDFGSVLSKIPFEILPEEMVDDLETASLKFQCCHSDNSLLISNYSDTSCSSDFGSFRISQAMNGQCFVIGNEDDVVEDDTDRMDSNAIREDTDDSFVFLLKWECNAFHHGCDNSNIRMLDESMLPQKCSEDCMKREEAIEAISNQGGAKHTAEKRKKVLGVVLAVVAIVVLFIGVIVGGMLYQRYKMTSDEAQANVAANISNNRGDDKYAAFVSVREDVGDVEMPKDTVQ
eukprot:554214_1